MEIKQQYLPVPSQRRSGEKLDKVQYIVAHDTGGVDGTAQSNVDWYIQTANGIKQASAHVFVDDTEAIWCVPEDEKAWSVRYDAGIAPNVAPHFMNDCAIAVELCYFSDLSRSETAYANYVQLIAELCSKHAIDPQTGIVAHKDLDPTRRTDPINAFSRIGKTWEQFLSDVRLTVSKINMENTANGAVKFVNFYGSDKSRITYFVESKTLQNDGETHDFASAEEALEKSTSESFVFWDNAPVGVGKVAE